MAGTLSLPFLCSSLKGTCPCLFLFAPKFGVGVGRAEISSAASGPHSILVSQRTTEPKTKGGGTGVRRWGLGLALLPMPLSGLRRRTLTQRPPCEGCGGCRDCVGLIPSFLTPSALFVLLHKPRGSAGLCGGPF